jgi:hypothetical protein
MRNQGDTSKSSSRIISERNGEIRLYFKNYGLTLESYRIQETIINSFAKTR